MCKLSICGKSSLWWAIRGRQHTRQLLTISKLSKSLWNGEKHRTGGWNRICWKMYSKEVELCRKTPIQHCSPTSFTVVGDISQNSLNDIYAAQMKRSFTVESSTGTTTSLRTDRQYKHGYSSRSKYLSRAAWNQQQEQFYPTTKHNAESEEEEEGRNRTERDASN